MPVPKPSQTKLKAYAVLETDENTGDIYFARSHGAARRAGANEHAGGNIDGVRCNRAPWADKYADTRIIPASVAICNGWRFEDDWSGETIDLDYLDDNKLPPSGVIGDTHGVIYACAAHEEASRIDESARKAAQAEGVAMLSERIAARFPDARILVDKSHSYASVTDGIALLQEAEVYFDFPGQTIGPASITLRRRFSQIGPIAPYFQCFKGDKVAFENYLDNK